MNKSYISLNEINLDTLVDYVDKTAIESGIFENHASALRDYYFNSNINFIIDNKLKKEEDFNKWILCIDSIYASDSTSGTLDEDNVKYTVKIKTGIVYEYTATKVETLPNGIIPEEVSGTITADNKYIEGYNKILDLVEILILNKKTFYVKVLGRDNDKTFILPTKLEVSDYLESNENVSCRYIKINNGNVYKLTIESVTLSYYPENVSVTDFNTFKQEFEKPSNKKYQFQVSAYIPRGSLLLEEKSNLSDKDAFMSNLQNYYEGGYTLSDISKVSPYRSDYLSNTKLNIQALFDLYSEENRIYQEYLIGENKQSNYFKTFNDYEQVVLYKPNEKTTSKESFNIKDITSIEANKLLKQAEDVGPYIRLKEYERFSTIDERYNYLLKEELIKKQLSTENTTSLRTPVGNIYNKNARVIQYKPPCKIDFKEYLSNLLSFYFYNDNDQQEYELNNKINGFGTVEKQKSSFSKYLQSHKSYYYDKINNAININNKYSDECNEIKVYTIYYEDIDQSETFKNIVEDLKNNWRFL